MMFMFPDTTKSNKSKSGIPPWSCYAGVGAALAPSLLRKDDWAWYVVYTTTIEQCTVATIHSVPRKVLLVM